MSERPGAREKIDAMTAHLVEHDPSLARDPRRAQRVAKDAARRYEHGESIHTEGDRPRN